jgi:hypothetical protein
MVGEDHRLPCSRQRIITGLQECEKRLDAGQRLGCGSCDALDARARSIKPGPDRRDIPLHHRQRVAVEGDQTHVVFEGRQRYPHAGVRKPAFIPPFRVIGQARARRLEVAADGYE